MCINEDDTTSISISTIDKLKHQIYLISTRDRLKYIGYVYNISNFNYR
jgi:hypothetical protein